LNLFFAEKEFNIHENIEFKPRLPASIFAMQRKEFFSNQTIVFSKKISAKFMAKKLK